MTPIYKVIMKHTEEILYDFIRFDSRIRHPMTKMHLIFLGTGFLVLGYLLRENFFPMLLACGIGILLYTILIIRNKIAFAKLSAQDEDYIKGIETEFVFGHSEIVIKNASWDEELHMKYAEVNVLYKDEKNYYLCRSNQELYLLPYSCFLLGDSEMFNSFISDKTGKICINTKMPFKERLKRMNERRKEADRIHDENIANNKKMK